MHSGRNSQNVYKYVKKETTNSPQRNYEEKGKGRETEKKSDVSNMNDDGYEAEKKPKISFPTLEPSVLHAAPMLMNDEEMASFIVKGYHVIDTNLPPEFHDALYEFANSLNMNRSDNPGNNVLPVIPSLQYIFGCPSVRGALTSILGPDYMMHPHRHPHNNLPGFKGQQFHKDSYFGYEMARHHYPLWVMAMYYPQDTPKILGPTGVAPGTQYSALPDTKKRHLDVTTVWDTKDVPLVCSKGTVVIIHYDLWHKGTPNNGDINRYMFKFQFLRMTPPRVPTWNSQSVDFPLKDPNVLSPVHIQIWKWLRGDSAPTKSNVPNAKNLFNSLKDNSVQGEPARLHAAYTLAQSEETAQQLVQCARSDTQCIRRSALYGLSTNKSPEIAHAVAKLLDDREVRWRNEVAAALGDMGKSAVIGLPALLKLLSDKYVPTRRDAIEAIGLILYNFVGEKLDLVQDEKFMGNFRLHMGHALTDEAEEVRLNACLSFARMAQIDPLVLSFIPELEILATTDPNRYVQMYALETLLRANSKESLQIALRILRNAQYCPFTSARSQF